MKRKSEKKCIMRELASLVPLCKHSEKYKGKECQVTSNEKIQYQLP